MDFVPGAVVVDGGIDAEGTALTDGRTLVSRDWTPGETVQVVGKTGSAEGVAPSEPRCLALFYLGLGDVRDATLQLSRDGTTVVVTSSAGRRVVDSWRGAAAADPGTDLIATPAEVPARCQGSIPVQAAIAVPGDGRVAAVEGPIPEGDEVGYRLTVYR
jgi:hypothetical protein